MTFLIKKRACLKNLLSRILDGYKKNGLEENHFELARLRLRESLVLPTHPGVALSLSVSQLIPDQSSRAFQLYRINGSDGDFNLQNFVYFMQDIMCFSFSTTVKKPPVTCKMIGSLVVIFERLLARFYKKLASQVTDPSQGLLKPTTSEWKKEALMKI